MFNVSKIITCITLLFYYMRSYGMIRNPMTIWCSTNLEDAALDFKIYDKLMSQHTHTLCRKYKVQKVENTAWNDQQLLVFFFCSIVVFTSIPTQPTNITNRSKNLANYRVTVQKNKQNTGCIAVYHFQHLLSDFR